MRVALAVLTVALGGSSYSDPVGDVTGAPDIARVRVTATASAVTVVATTTDASSWTGAVAFLPVDTNGDAEPDETYTLHSEHTLVTRDTDSGAVRTKATATLDGATLTYVVPRSELGSAAAIGLAVRTAGDSGSDSAPDSGLVRVALLSFTPGHPVHGRRFTVNGASSCSARIGTKRLVGRCTWTIPASAKGKTLVLAVNGRTYRLRIS